MRQSAHNVSERETVALDRSSYVPVYVQIRERLRKLIQLRLERGESSFLTDSQIASQFGVSRMTAREAIRDLVAEGVLYRVRGRGTFIAGPKTTVEPTTSLANFFAQWSLQGRSVSVEVREFAIRPCSQPFASYLGVPEGTGVLFICRLRYADGIPTALDHRYLPRNVGALVEREALYHTPLHVHLGPRIRVPIRGAVVEIEAQGATREEAALLKLEPGTPVLVRTATIVGTSNRPLWTGRSIFRGDSFKYSMFVPGGD